MKFPISTVAAFAAAFAAALASTSADTSIGLNFCGGWAATHIADATADGFAGWTDARQENDWNNPAMQSTPLVLGESAVGVTWNASNTWAAGSEADNEQALYREYLDDSQTDPTTSGLGGSTSDRIGIRVKITGLADWLNATGHTSYQIRAYASTDSGNASFHTITIHQGNAVGPLLATITPTVGGQAGYPTAPGAVHGDR